MQRRRGGRAVEPVHEFAVRVGAVIRPEGGYTSEYALRAPLAVVLLVVVVSLLRCAFPGPGCDSSGCVSGASCRR